MKLIIGTRMDSSTHDWLRFELGNLEENIKLFFCDKSYSIFVDKISIDLVYDRDSMLGCYKRMVYHEDKVIKPFANLDYTERLFHLLLVDIPLPDDFITCPYEESLIIVRDAVIGYFRETPLPVKLRKSFDMERFLADLTTFFKRIDLRTGMWKTEGPTV